jgi:hypothetical protein
MEKTSKVTHIAGNGTWESPQYGTFYKFEVGMENNDIGEYMSKTQDQSKFKLGQDATYTIEGKDYNGKTFYRIKPVETKPSFTPRVADPEKELKITRMSVLKASTDLVVAGKIPMDKIIEYSKHFEAYVMEGKDLINKTKSEDDLPF